jgi:hypothetical protein
MLTAEVIDTVDATDVEVGDYVSVYGIVEGEVVQVDDLGDAMALYIIDNDEYGEVVRHVLSPDDTIEVLG